MEEGITMKQLLYLVLSLVVIAAITPHASAVFEWHTGTWSASQNATGFPATNLSTFPEGGTWMTRYDQVDSLCYDLTNTSMNLTYVTVGLAECGLVTRYWYPIIGDSCYNGVAISQSYYGGAPYSDLEFSTTHSSIGHRYFSIRTAGTGYCYQSISNVKLYFDGIPVKMVNFTGVPTTGPSPLSVTFTAINVTAPNIVSWSFGDGNITTSATSPISHIYPNQGIYSVILNYNYNNGSGLQNSVQKINYITVGTSNATKTKYFQTIDGTSGNIVTNSTINLKDVENSSWINGTFPADGMSSITTLVGHHINAYASLTGFSDADDLNVLNDGEPRYIMMWPTFAKNVSAGNVSLYVTVQDKDTRAAIVGAGVTISPSVGSAQSTTTNSAGIAYFVVTNKTSVYITATAPGLGYKPAVTTINTGTGSGGSASAAATILLSKGLVTPTFTTAVTTLPGGGTPTPTVTVLPGCEDQVSSEGQAKCRAAQSNQGLSYLSAHMMDLIIICVFVTIMYLLGIRLGK